ncbi:MAG: hypothetical protein LBU51_03210 [Bacteroidales bacterium]|jgi:hypothetical protein|nr:hypothetical protein [Bacteroidales bacterium]
MLSNIKLNALLSITLVAFISLFSLVLSSSNAMAIPPTPPPDCPGTPFQGPIYEEITIGSCKITYTYWWRTGCNEYNDAYIESFELGPNCGIFDPNDYDNICDGIMADIVVFKNPWGGAVVPNCEDTPGWTNTKWRFFRPSCFTDAMPIWIENSEGNYILVSKVMPCVTQEMMGYCYKTYQYCWELVNSERQLNTRTLGSGKFGNNLYCPGFYIGTDGVTYQCYPSCEE